MLVPLAANAPSFGSAGGKLALERRDHVSPTVLRYQDVELAINRVAEDYAVIGIPKGHSIEKSRWVFVFELQRPRGACIGSFINSRSRSFPNAQHVCGLSIDCIDVAKVNGVSRDS